MEPADQVGVGGGELARARSVYQRFRCPETVDVRIEAGMRRDDHLTCLALELEHVREAGVEGDFGELDGDESGVQAGGVFGDDVGELLARLGEQLATATLELVVGEDLHAQESVGEFSVYAGVGQQRLRMHVCGIALGFGGDLLAHELACTLRQAGVVLDIESFQVCGNIDTRVH